MSDLPRASSHPTSFPPSPSVTSPAAVYLRIEQASASDPAHKALLLHELGVVEERLGDEMGAAREYLSAYNSYSQFREPLEGLVRLLERRKSLKNLPKLLDALLRAAESPEEKARALVKRAAFFTDHKKDDAGAKAALLQATAERPGDATPWLELEVLAGRTQDAVQRADALEARAKLEENLTWRGLLYIDLSDVLAKKGELERAIEVLKSAMELEGAARYRATMALERHATRENLPEVLATALEAQGELIASALVSPGEGDRFGVPLAKRSAEAAGDAWLRAADARRLLGDLGGAAKLFDRALESVGPRPAILTARLALAEAAGDTHTAERLAETLLDQGVTGSGRASLFMRVAEAAANRDDAAGALTALLRALEADPGCIPARALQIDLLGNAEGAGALASAIENMAAELPTDQGRGRAFLLSAYVFAVQAADVAGAKAALTQAGMNGVTPGVLARTSRMLASLVGDQTWYEEATKRLLTAGAEAREHRSLWFELGRMRLLRGDHDGAAQAFAAIADAERGSFLGRALSAYALGHESHEGDGAHGAHAAAEASGTLGARRLAPEALDRLRQVEPNLRTSRAIAVAAARRADLIGDKDAALARLTELFASDPHDLVVAMFVAELEKRREHPAQAAAVLAKVASSLEDPKVAASLHLEAGVLLFRAGARRDAVEQFEAAIAGAGVTTVAPLLGWALRGVAPKDLAERGRLLERALDFTDDTVLLALEHVSLAVLTAGSDAREIETLLEQVEQHAEGELRTAVALLRVLWDEKATSEEAFANALRRVGEAGGKATPIAAWESLRRARQDGDRERANHYARVLAQATRSLPEGIEWLGAAMGHGDRDEEIAARHLIAARLTGEARSAVLSHASMISLLMSPMAPGPLLTDRDAHSRLMNLELALPGGETRRRAIALGEIEDALGDEARLDALTMAGYNYLAIGASEDALASFFTVTGERPDDLFAWEGLRSAAEALGDVETQASACARLGELVKDDARGAEFWEKAALLKLDVLKNEAEGDAALERAFARDPKRTVAFDRLFRSVRKRGEADRLLSLIARRLENAEEPSELSKLFWERARVLRQKGDRDGALLALQNVTMIEPDHVGALALKGEIDITQSNFEGAAHNLSRLATLKDAPPQQRLMSGVAAVDLYENKLNDTARALEVLVALHESGLSTLPVRERMARAAAKTSSWTHATSILEELMNERATAAGRIEAARLCMAIWRDKLNAPLKAEKAVSKLLNESPEDGEGLDHLLTYDFPEVLKKHLLLRGRVALIDSLADNPVDEPRIARLAGAARALGDLPLRQATLGTMKAFAGVATGVEQELSMLDARVARLPQVAVDERTIGLIGDPDDAGALPQLFVALAAGLSSALGPSLETLGVGRKQKVDPRSGLPLRNEVAAWAGALGLGEFDLYVGGNEAHAVHGVAGDVPALVVGTGVSLPLTASGRQAIVRELFALRRGISVTRTRDETTVAAIVVAAANLAEVRMDSPPYAMVNDVQRQLGKSISRRVRKQLPDLMRAVVNEAKDAKAWARAAQSSMYRMAAIAAGDVSLVLSDALGVPLGRLPVLIPHDERARRLIAFVLSPRYLELRGKLGMGVT